MDDGFDADSVVSLMSVYADVVIHSLEPSWSSLEMSTTLAGNG